MGERRPYAPRGALKTSGTRLWRDVVGRYELDPVELTLLFQLCRTVDELDAVNAAIKKSGPVVDGSTGQMRANPLYHEFRELTKITDQLSRSLALPVGPETTGKRRGSAAKLNARAARPKKSRGRLATVTAMHRKDDDDG